MRLLTVTVLILAFGASAYAQTAESSKPASTAVACHAKSAKCASAKPRKKAASTDGMKAQSISQCRDVRTHRFTKCGGPYAEPVPAN
jgi:hypothetical protein